MRAVRGCAEAEQTPRVGYACRGSCYAMSTRSIEPSEANGGPRVGARLALRPTG